jgi:hypothetical protein
MKHLIVQWLLCSHQYIHQALCNERIHGVRATVNLLLWCGKQQQQQQQQHRRDITSVVLGCTALAAAAAAAAAQQQQKNHSNGVGEQLPKWTSTCTVGADSKNAFDRAPTP